MKTYFKFASVVCCAAVFSLVNVKADTIPVQVGQGGLKFVPANVSIHVGDTVQWTWAASGHSSTSGTPGNPDGMWDSGIQNSGFVFTHTFTTAGTFPYYCTPHGGCCGMVGTVTVTQAIDTVTITRAQYNSTNMQLTVAATDSDPTATLTVSVTSTGQILGTMRTRGDGNYSAKFAHVATNPRMITVSSSLGGTATSRVRQ
ncbi:MAG TPA: plastocyanin/azurin family copper-binding protein [Chthoniobacterales bacterium]